MSLKEAVEHLGYQTIHDLTTDHSDAVGLFITRTQKHANMVVKTLREYGGDYEEVFEVLETSGVRFAYVLEDWKHLDWQNTSKSLEEIGLKLTPQNKDATKFALEKI
jgi:intergrase/recombinase